MRTSKFASTKLTVAVLLMLAGPAAAQDSGSDKDASAKQEDQSQQAEERRNLGGPDQVDNQLGTDASPKQPGKQSGRQ